MNSRLTPIFHASLHAAPARRKARGWLMGIGMLALASIASAAPLASEEQELANRLVGDRGQHRDSRRMVLDPVLTAVARARAEDMAKRRYFSHTDPDGNGPNFLARSAGYPLPAEWGRSRGGNFIESICAGHATAEAAWESWMRSPMHRTHLLAQSSFYRGQTNFGVGFYSDPGSPYRSYWVVLTAPPSSGGDATSASRSPAKPIRIALSFPLWRKAPKGTPIPAAVETAPRPSASRPAAPEKLWNWEANTAASRPLRPRLIGAE